MAAHSLTITATPLGGGAGGQAAPSENANNNGSTFLRLYQAEAAGVTPGDPVDPWSLADGFVEDFGDWVEDPPVLASGEVLWVANGGTSLDSNGARQNRAWQVYATLTEQYAVTIQDTTTYTLDRNTAGLRFVRSMLPAGWGAWKRLEDGTDGWVDVITDEYAYAPNLASSFQHSIAGGFDAEYFREIEIEARSFGNFDANSNPINLGGKDQWRYRRTQGDWTEEFDPTDNRIYHGAFKMRYYDEIGLSGLAVLSNAIDDEVTGGLGPPGAGLPPRRTAFRVKLIGENTTNPNNIIAVRIGPFAAANHYMLVSVRMR